MPFESYLAGSRLALLVTVTLLCLVSGAVHPTLFAQAPATSDYTIHLQPSRLIIVAGTTGGAGVAFGSVNGFTGNIVVTLSISPAIPNAPVPTFPYPYAELNTTTPSEYNFTISTALTTPLGLYNITATGTNGSLTHSATLTFGVSNTQVPFNGAELVSKPWWKYTPAYPGSTIFFQDNFSDVGFLPVAVTNTLVTFSFGMYESAAGQSFSLNPFVEGTTGFAVTVPDNLSPGTYAYTVNASWVLSPYTISQTQGPNLVSHGSLQVYANNPLPGFATSLRTFLPPLFAVAFAIGVLSIMVVRRHEKTKQSRMGETIRPVET